jgi:predicted RND superfamily exporter protein/signal transduction histidine kinase
MIVDVVHRLESHPLVTKIESPATSPIIVTAGNDIEVRQLVEGGIVVEDRDKLAQLAMNDPLWQGTLVSPDGKVGAIVVQLSSTESRVTAEIVPAIREALEPHEAEGFVFYLVGDPIDFVVSGGQLQADTPLIVGVMLIFLIVAAWFLLRSLLAILLALGSSGLAVGWAMGAMSWLDWPEMELTQALRPGILVITLCTAIHVVTRYSERAVSGTESTPEQRKGWIDDVTRDVGPACLLTALTTAAGFLSFISSGMSSFSQFGITAAIGVAAGLLLSFTALPIMLIRFDPRRLRSDGVQRTWAAVLQQIGVVAEQRPRAVLITSSLLMIVSIYGWTQLRVDVNERELLGENAKVVRWARFFEENLRKADSLEIHLIAPADRSFLEPEGIEILRDVSVHLSSLKGLGQTRSVLDLLRAANQAAHDDDGAYFHAADTHAENAQLAFILEMAPGTPLSSWISFDRHARISVEADPTSAKQRTVTLEKVEAYLGGRLPDGWSYSLSGPLAVYLAFTDILQKTQLWSFAFAAICVSALLWIYFRSSGLTNLSALKWTVVGMFPTALPVVVTLGAMGLLDVPLDVGTAMVGAIILGIAVDDSIHLITAFRTNRRNGLRTREAMLSAMMQTGQALVTSSVAISIGLFALMTSSWQSIASFGLLSGIAIWGALIADLVVLPAIILFFYGRANPTKKLPSTISDTPSFAERSGTTLMVGLLGMSTLAILLGALGGESSKGLPRCSILENGALSPFSILDTTCPLESRDIVRSVRVGDRVYKPEEFSGRRDLSGIDSTVVYHLVRSGERQTIETTTGSFSDSIWTVRHAVGSLAVLVPLFAGLSVLWLSKAQAAIPVAILSISLGVSAAGILVGSHWIELPLPSFIAFAMTPASMIHLSMSFPRRSVVLQRAPRILGLIYGVAGVSMIGMLWAARSHPTVWKVVLFLGLAISALAWLRILVAGLLDRDSQDSLEQHRASLTTWISLGLLATLSLAAATLQLSQSQTVALGLVLVPLPIGYAVVKYHFFDARPYIRTLGLFAISTILYVGFVGVGIYALVLVDGNEPGAEQLGIALLVLLVAEVVRFAVGSIASRRLPTAGYRLHELELQFVEQTKGQSQEQAVCQAASDVLLVGLASSGVSVALRSDIAWRVVAASGSPPNLADGLEELASFLSTRTAPVDLGPEGGEQGSYGSILRSREVAVAASIIWNEQLLGTILVSPPRDLLPFHDEEINFIQRICHYASVAIHNVRITEELILLERSETQELIARRLMHSVARPMAIIAQSTKRYAMRGAPPEELEDFLEDVRLASQETLDGLDQMRTRAVSNRLGRSSPQSAQGIVERAVQIVSRLHGGANFVVRPTADLPLVLHSEEIRRVITSLLDNALIATESGDLMPEIRITSRAGIVRFEVEDFGCGMSPDVLDKATQAFFTTRRHEGGSGIGLLDARMTVETLGGQFELESREGKGTTATIWIPARLSVPTNSQGLEHVQ